MRYIFLLLLASMALVACSSKAEVDRSELQLSGIISGANGQTLYLDEYPLNSTKLITIDSVVLDEKGNYEFKFGHKADEPMFYMLRFSQYNWVVVLLDKSDKAKVNGDFKSFAQEYKVEGSDASDKLRNLLSGLRKNGEQIQALQQGMKGLNPREAKYASERKAAQDKMNQLIGQNVGSIKDLASTSGTNPLAAYAAMFLDPAQDYSYIDGIHKKFKAEKPESAYTKALDAVLAPARGQAATAVGAEAPNFTLLDDKGVERQLTEFRGKLLLLDFWASWCAPCRRENPNVVRVYEQYKDQGFEILGISLDTKKPSWLAAIRADKLSWHHVSDLKGWKSSAAKLYGVGSIPATFLLSADGKILAKNLRGKALEAKIAEILGS